MAFALTPAAAIGGIIDYTTTEGRKLYSSATKPLSDEYFDCKADQLYTFLQRLSDQATEFGWDDPIVGILQIPRDHTNPASVLDYLVDGHGFITMEKIRDFETSYLSTRSRPVQDNYMLYLCLMNSLSTEGRSRISLWKADYTVNDKVSGNLSLKVIIRESHIDTQATSGTIRLKLSSLDRYLPTVNSDISKFNQHVQLLVDSLRTRGETKDGLVYDLFKGYLTCSDRKFVQYIERKQQDFNRNNTITAPELMILAENMYKLMKESGTWCAPSAEEEKLLALQAQIKALKKGKPRQANKTDSATTSGKRPPQDSKSTSQTQPKKKPDWFNRKPLADELRKPKKWDGKDWWWCGPENGGKCEGTYRRHKPSECEGKAHKFKSGGNKKLKLAKALAATAAQNDPDDGVYGNDDGDY